MYSFLSNIWWCNSVLWWHRRSAVCEYTCACYVPDSSGCDCHQQRNNDKCNTCWIQKKYNFLLNQQHLDFATRKQTSYFSLRKTDHYILTAISLTVSLYKYWLADLPLLSVYLYSSNWKLGTTQTGFRWSVFQRTLLLWLTVTKFCLMI